VTEQRNVNGGRFARWREHRRAKRQQAIERQYFETERARSSDSACAAATEQLNASTRVGAYGTIGTAFYSVLGGGGA
jgi:hypothetical protein